MMVSPATMASSGSLAPSSGRRGIGHPNLLGGGREFWPPSRWLTIMETRTRRPWKERVKIYS